MKIEIKDIYGKVLFSSEKEDNTIKSTLTEAVKSRANLYGANLYGAKIKDVIIEKATSIVGLYKYTTIPIISQDLKHYVKMGCYLRSVEEWEKDFWNNPDEFTDHESMEGKLRLFAFETAKKWLELNK